MERNALATRGQAESDVSAGQWLCVAAQELLIRWSGVVAVLTTTRRLFGKPIDFLAEGRRVWCGVACSPPQSKQRAPTLLPPSLLPPLLGPFIACLLFSLDIAVLGRAR
jgi:hypothetical protein